MTNATKAVFLSYAREDSGAARRIAEALRAAGLEVWFDENELRGGDAWDAKIRQQIDACALFIPLISAHTQERSKGYFRLEWKLAVDQTHLLAAGVPFIAPVAIDDTKEAGALVPPEFMKVQWTRLPGALPTPEFVAQVKRLLGASTPVGATPAAANTAADSPATPAPKKSSLALALVVGFASIAVSAGLVLVVMRRGEPAKPASEAKPAVAPAAPAKPARLADKSIAVLPFTNMSEDKDSGYFADGVHEDVLTNLALVRELRVVSRTSVQTYRNTTKSMKQIAEELGVTYILEGSVRRSGNKVRVTGQLIHAATDEHVWAQTYDRDLNDVFAIQTELSQQIAAALKTALSPEEKVLIARRPTENTAAYDLFLRARDMRNREPNNPISLRRRAELLEKAVQLDPAFAQAWGDLAATYAYAVFLDYDGRDESLAKAKAAIDRAVALSPDDPEIIGSLGTYYYYGYRDYARATELFERRARLQPNSAVVFNSLALVQRRQGRWAEALANFRRASELDPASTSYLRNLVSTLSAGRRYREASEVQQRIANRFPERITEAYTAAMFDYLASGSTARVDAFFAGLPKDVRESPRGIDLRRGWARTRGDYAEAVRLDELQPYFDDDGVPRWRQAYAAAGDLYFLGDRPAALRRLGNAEAELRQRLEQEPGNASNWAMLAGLEVMLGHKDAAMRSVERSAQLLPESRDAIEGVNAAINRAFCLALLGEKERALPEFQRLLRTPSGINVQDLDILRKEYAGDRRFEALFADPRNREPLF
jgi:TolB-like protein/cytochrome c-type biogenesis protein CcmH/NrfG